MFKSIGKFLSDVFDGVVDIVVDVVESAIGFLHQKLIFQIFHKIKPIKMQGVF